MLKKILDNKTCAECKLCCVFDRYDVWETPVFDKKTKEFLEKEKNAEFISKDGGYIFKVDKFDEEGLFTCPALDCKTGCILKDEKPFDCRIWPYRIMRLGEKRVISIASICDAMYHKPLSELTDFLKDGLADTIFKYADEHPEIIKPYDHSYPVLFVEDVLPCDSENVTVHDDLYNLTLIVNQWFNMEKNIEDSWKDELYYNFLLEINYCVNMSETINELARHIQRLTKDYIRTEKTYCECQKISQKIFNRIKNN